MVPRGGLPRFKQFNDLEGGGSIDLPTRSLCFLARVTHWRGGQSPQMRTAAQGWHPGGMMPLQQPDDDGDRQEFAG